MIKQLHSWVYTQKSQKQSQRAICTSTFTAASFTIAKTWKQFKCQFKC